MLPASRFSLLWQVDDEAWKQAVAKASPGAQIMRASSTYASEEVGFGGGGDGCAQQ